MPRFESLVFLSLVVSLSTSCAQDDLSKEISKAPLVVVAHLETVETEKWAASGKIDAETKSPLAFQVSGKIAIRHVSAGERVRTGELLMTLEPKDLRESVAGVEAKVNGARAEAANLITERNRLKRLLDQNLIPHQDFDRANTAADAGLNRLITAEAELVQVRNALNYADLTAPFSGVVLSVMAESGQVVAPGQTVAVIAKDGPREVEVQIPLRRRSEVPELARAIIREPAVVLDAKLRQLDAAADPFSHTWQARYVLEGEVTPELGTIVKLEFTDPQIGGTSTEYTRRVPVGALYERGEGSHLWVIADNKVTPKPVKVLRLSTEHAYVATELAAGTPVVAMGTHLLTPGQEVRTTE